MGRGWVSGDVWSASICDPIGTSNSLLSERESDEKGRQNPARLGLISFPYSAKSEGLADICDPIGPHIVSEANEAAGRKDWRLDEIRPQIVSVTSGSPSKRRPSKSGPGGLRTISPASGAH